MSAQAAQAGDWVEVQRTILTPDQRAAGLPADTAATPLNQWVSGFLNAAASVGDEVEVTSIIGRKHRGVLSRINPSYTHSFGTTMAELLTIGTEREA